MGNTTNFSDILKKSFLEQFGYYNSPLTMSRVIITLLITLAIGIMIFYVYKKTFNGVLYTHSYNVSLVMISLVTALIIMTISSNITLSLGMVGALSIVRFRTAIKDPMDIVFMFWALAVGITNGAGLFLVSITGSIIIGLILISFTYIKLRNSAPYLLVLHYEHGAVVPIKEILPKSNLKSKTVTAQGIELTVEVRVRDDDTSFVDEFVKIDGVKDAALISYNGDYVS